MIDTKTVSGIMFEDVDHRDAPDYVDAYISEAEIDGVPATEEQLEELNNMDDFKYEKLMEWLY